MILCQRCFFGVGFILGKALPPRAVLGASVGSFRCFWGIRRVPKTAYVDDSAKQVQTPSLSAGKGWLTYVLCALLHTSISVFVCPQLPILL